MGDNFNVLVEQLNPGRKLKASRGALGFRVGLYGLIPVPTPEFLCDKEKESHPPLQHSFCLV